MHVLLYWHNQRGKQQSGSARLGVLPPPHTSLSCQFPPDPNGTPNSSAHCVATTRQVENPETRLDWHWWQTQDGGPSVGTQYVAAISMGMRQEWLFTDSERIFSVFASLVIALIYGAIDALVVTSFMTMNAGDQAKAQHESALKVATDRDVALLQAALF